uniref:DNA fragmentation factor, alpha polypeptide n=1 Tax=Lepisosteus oculatus TaxID=7918 RepID=W5MHN8_LEPOC|nr:PREDICTED: DNA fragmentation factor subunit alpha isoform X1 [Lepisosteus oculatus]
MSDPKPCRVCNYSRKKSYGIAVQSLDQLKIKGSELLGFTSEDLVSVVLEEDGTIVEDEVYFLCLPSNTKFMLLKDKERWAPITKVDGGTAWLGVGGEADEVDRAVPGAEGWQEPARRLQQDLSAIVLMSEADLQGLADAPCGTLAAALGYEEARTRALQDTLQGVLDRRQEERQAKELLQLYLRAAQGESRAGETAGPRGARIEVPGQDVTDGKEMEVDAAGRGASKFSQRTLMVLKGKTSPETRLSNQELQLLINEGARTMSDVLGWDMEKAENVLQACEDEMKKRLEKVSAMHSLSSLSQRPMAEEENGETKAKRQK